MASTSAQGCFQSPPSSRRSSGSSPPSTIDPTASLNSSRLGLVPKARLSSLLQIGETNQRGRNSSSGSNARLSGRSNLSVPRPPRAVKPPPPIGVPLPPTELVPLPVPLPPTELAPSASWEIEGDPPLSKRVSDDTVPRPSLAGFRSKSLLSFSRISTCSNGTKATLGDSKYKEKKFRFQRTKLVRSANARPGNQNWFSRNLRGSVFPQAMPIGLSSAFIAGAMYWLVENELIYIGGDDSPLKEFVAWTGFTFLVSFLVVFKTSQAYSRFWEGSTAAHSMRAEWFSACSMLVAFCEHSTEVDLVEDFKHLVIRLFSILHAMALAEVEDCSSTNLEDFEAFGFDLIDPGCIDRDSLLELKGSESKVETVYHWIQCLVVKYMRNGALTIPPPVLSGAFRKLADGMLQFHEATKISCVPFPFPYNQTCDCLLIIHFIICPFVATQWVSHWCWASTFTFIQVFILWSLNFIALEIENPFGHEANDLDGGSMQTEFNRQLLVMLAPNANVPPDIALEGSDASDANDWGGDPDLNHEEHEDVLAELGSSPSGRTENNADGIIRRGPRESVSMTGKHRVSLQSGGLADIWRNLESNGSAKTPCRKSTRATTQPTCAVSDEDIAALRSIHRSQTETFNKTSIQAGGLADIWRAAESNSSAKPACRTSRTRIQPEPNDEDAASVLPSLDRSCYDADSALPLPPYSTAGEPADRELAKNASLERVTADAPAPSAFMWSSRSSRSVHFT